MSPLRSDQEGSPETYLVADLRVDAGRQCVFRGDVEVALPNLSFRLLVAVLTPLAGSPFPVAVNHTIATDRTGTFLYVTTGASVVGYLIDASTGLLKETAGSPIAAGSNAYSLMFDPSGQFLYVTNDGSASVSGYRPDGAGGLTAISGSPFAAGNRPDSLAIF